MLSIKWKDVLSIWANNWGVGILTYDHFGTHLDNDNKTVNKELELQNFD